MASNLNLSQTEKCKQCEQIVITENSICCDICDTWFHLKCTCLTLKTFKSMFVSSSTKWFCKFCILEALPFGNINDNMLLSQTSTNKTNKAILNYIKLKNLSTTCSICDKKTIRNKGIPCSICNSLIHKKCSKTNKFTFNNFKEIKVWICPKCIQNNLPFMNINNYEFIQSQSQYENSSTPNSNLNACNLRETFNTKLLTTNLTNINFNYYDLELFQELCTNQISKNNFSIFHSNISSLQGNFDKLELLLS